jgi:hypothetical protein
MSHYISIDTQNTNEALLLCHNFNVESQDIKTERDIWIPDKKAIVRRDTNQYLGTVGKGWEPVQPIVLYNMAEELIQATDGRINGLINMLDGAVIGISFKLAEREFVEDDKIDLNFLMLTAFNGQYGLSGSAIAYRHANDSMANTSNKVFNLKHTKFVGNRIEVVKDMLKYYNQEIRSFDMLMNKLVTKPMSEEQAIEWFTTLFPKANTTRSSRLLETAVDKFAILLRENGRVSGVSGTSYGAWCALAQYINHYRTIRVHNDRDPEEVRYQTINFGTGNAMMQKGIKKLTNDYFDEEEFMID